MDGWEEGWSPFRERCMGGRGTVWPPVGDPVVFYQLCSKKILTVSPWPASFLLSSSSCRP